MDADAPAEAVLAFGRRFLAIKVYGTPAVIGAYDALFFER